MFIDLGIFTVVVNKQSIVNIGGALEQDAVRILRDVPGVAIEPRGETGDRPDVIIRAGHVMAVVQVKAQQLTNAAAAQQLIAYARSLPETTHLIVVARSITREARARLAEEGIGFLDATGAKSLDLPGLFLWTEGGRHPNKGKAGSESHGIKLAGKAGVATQALLIDPARPWKIHDLATAADVSVGLVHRLFVRLEREEVVEAAGAGPQKSRRVTNPAALLDLWAEEMRDRGTRELRAYRLARDPRSQTTALSRALTEADVKHAVTGAAAAARLAPFVTAVPVTDVWVSELDALEHAANAARAQEVTEGHNVIFRSAKDDAPLAFRKRCDGVWLANTLRVFLDLRADPRRGREQGVRLREEVIGF
jgi:hypothetical protein